MHGKTNKNLIYFFGALGGMLYGYDTGVISGALLFIKQDIQLTDFLQGLVVSAILIGAIIGAGCSGPLSDRLGRRRVVLLVAIIFIIGALGSAFSPNAAVLIIFRIILGLAVGGSSALVPVYLSEMAPTEMRGALASLNQLMITIGILVAYIVNYAFAPIDGWRWMLGLAVVPAVILMIGIYFMPESPRWLIQKNREKDARQVLGMTRQSNQIEKEIEDIKETEKQKSAGFKELGASWVRPMLIAGIGLAIFQQFIGINAVIYYAPTIFTKAGMGASASILGTVGIGIVNVILTIVAIKIIDKVGRKKLLLVGNVGMILSILILGLLLMFFGLTASTAWITVICLAAFIAFFAISWGPVVWVMLPEIFPLKVRGAGTGAMALLLFVANLIVSLTFPVLLSALGISTVFLIYAAIGVLAYLFVYFFVPETKGRSLEEIEQDLRNKISVK